MAKRDGYTVCVGDAASQIGKNVKVRVERFVDGTAYATLVSKAKDGAEPITAEGQAEKPTRKPPTRKQAKAEAGTVETASAAEPVADEEQPEPAAEESAEEPKPKKKTRRGSRGGRGRKKKPAAAPGAAAAQDGAAQAPTIHVPDPSLGQEPEEPETEPVSANGDTKSEVEVAPKPRKKTRRGSRGGRNRRKKPATTTADEADETAAGAEPAEPESDEYVPMSEWIDEVESR
jgi:ribonuclease E